MNDIEYDLTTLDLTLKLWSSFYIILSVIISFSHTSTAEM